MLNIISKLNDTLTCFGDLLDYPQEDYCSLAEKAVVASGNNTEAKLPLEKFAQAISQFTLGEMQEIYTRTFDVAPICIPYLSSYIHGEESFDRGNLMANLVSAYKQKEFSFAGELPDHLRTLIRFLTLLDDEEKSDLINYVIMDPLKEMVEKLKVSENPYLHLLNALQFVLSNDLEGSNA